MLLITVATENEISPLVPFLKSRNRVKTLICGMGPVATAASLSNYLSLHGAEVSGVLNIGVAGAYVGSGVGMLDICMAQQEFLGDFGICTQDGIEDFAPDLPALGPPLLFNNDLTEKYNSILTKKNIPFHLTNFVTVNCCTGTMKRAMFLRDKFNAGCENMEGAAVATVCRNFNTPCAEIRCISNMVEDRDPASWKLEEAIDKICWIVRILLQD